MDSHRGYLGHWTIPPHHVSSPFEFPELKSISVSQPRKTKVPNIVLSDFYLARGYDGGGMRERGGRRGDE